MIVNKKFLYIVKSIKESFLNFNTLKFICNMKN